ncbi:MAG: hypothetical protein ABIN36_14135 [Ferruginibacter sp.]
MKKVMIASAILFFAAVTNVNSQVEQKMDKKDTTGKTQPLSQQTKTPIKPEELPEAVRTTATGGDFKDWAISSAFLVKTSNSEYYELVFIKEKETRTVNFDKSGKPMA